MVEKTSALTTALWLAAGAAMGQVSPNGGEFQVNTYTTSTQLHSAVAADSAGNFVVVWRSAGSTGTDTSSSSIQARRFDVAGAPSGEDFQVNSTTAGFQSSPDVAADAEGRFVVVWFDPIDPYGYQVDLRAQRFDAGGAPAGGEFRVNTLPIGRTELYGPGPPRVAAGSSGEFVVVWSSFLSDGSDSNGFSIQARRYDSEGNPLTSPFQVNTYTTGWQYYSSVASNPAGGFIVAWHSHGSDGTDTSGSSIQARLYDADGEPLSTELQVNTFTTNSQRSPSIAASGAGSFVIAWESRGSSGDDADGFSVQARRFDPSGAPLGDEFQVNGYTTLDQRAPAVIADARGNFFVTWESFGSTGSDVSLASIQGRQFAADGASPGGEFQVNAYTTSFQWFPSVASDSLGNFVVTWSSSGSSGSDTDSSSIQGQRYDALFRDGFETGDAGRWSGVSP